MSTVQIIKLVNGNVIIRDGKGLAKVITPPKGVDYNEANKSWIARHPHPQYDYWTGTTFPVAKVDPIKAFKAAVDCREQHLHYLLNRRLLPRLRKAYAVVENGKGFGVWDHFEKTMVYFGTMMEAKAFNEAIIERYTSKYKLTRNRMITLAEFAS